MNEEEKHKHHRRRHPKKGINFLWILAFTILIAGFAIAIGDIENKLTNIQKTIDARVVGTTVFQAPAMTIFMEEGGAFVTNQKEEITIKALKPKGRKEK